MLTEHFGKPPDTSVNPDEAVAIGAAVMGELIQSGEPKKRAFLSAGTTRNFGIMRISDVCSHSLGMVALAENGELRNSTIIPKNTNIPCNVSRDDYLTTSPNQTEFDVIVLQGAEELEPRYCPVHDAYEVYDIPPRPAGETRIKVTFKYNTDGVIEVEAEDVSSKRVLPIRKKVEDIDWDALVAPEPVSMPMDIALVIDCSGSMSGGEIDDAKDAASRFLDNIDPSSHVGLVSFGARVKIEMPLTQDFDRLRQAIENLRTWGTTPMTEAIALTRERVLVNSQNTNVLILLTDGLPDDEDTTRTEAELAKQQGFQIIAIGVGDGVDSDYLKQISSTPEDYYFVQESVQLESTFTTIASRLVTESTGRTRWHHETIMHIQIRCLIKEVVILNKEEQTIDETTEVADTDTTDDPSVEERSDDTKNASGTDTKTEPSDADSSPDENRDDSQAEPDPGETVTTEPQPSRSEPDAEYMSILTSVDQHLLKIGGAVYGTDRPQPEPETDV